MARNARQGGSCPNGAQRLPEPARSLGRSTGEFKKAQAELEKVGTEVTSPNRTPDGKGQP